MGFPADRARTENVTTPDPTPEESALLLAWETCVRATVERIASGPFGVSAEHRRSLLIDAQVCVNESGRVLVQIEREMRGGQ